MLILVGAAAGSAVWFTIVQKWVIRAFCPYCMATHIAGLLLTALVMWRVPRQFDDDTTDFAQTMAAVETAKGSAPRSNRGPLPAFGLAVVGVALAGILAASQVAIKPRGVYRGGDSRIVLPALDPHAVPIVGSPDAPYVVTLLFDYKCPHCQHLHFLLAEAIRRYGGKLAFVLCPAPLSRQCNPYIPRDVDEFKDSCELAKIGLAVWLAKREAFPAFDGWMFSMESGERWEPRSLDAANAKAIELAGRTKFDAARANPWIDQYLQTSIRVYSQTLQSGTGVPKFVFGSRWVLPKPFDADDLVSVLHDSLGLPNP
jgi:protein-disulfide isomerase